MILKYDESTNDVCPHCGVHVLFLMSNFDNDTEGLFYCYKKHPISVSRVYFHDPMNQSEFFIYTSTCPKCQRPIVCQGKIIKGMNVWQRTYDEAVFDRLIYPRSQFRKIPQNLQEEIKQDYVEAIETLQISEKASAALSRRCLQSILNENGFPGSDLSNQIGKALSDLPQYISKNLDAIRAIGNIGVHPIKSKETGDILGVAPDEARLLLDVLDQLIDYFYIQQKKAKEITDRVNEKLREAGKPPMKGLK